MVCSFIKYGVNICLNCIGCNVRYAFCIFAYVVLNLTSTDSCSLHVITLSVRFDVICVVTNSVFKNNSYVYTL